MAPRSDIAGVILAGGRSSRMGGRDKALLAVAGTSLLDRAVATLAPQVGPLCLNSDSEAVRRTLPGVPAVADALPGFAGPLAGLLGALDWMRDHHPGCRWLVSVPVDAPLFPADLVARLAAAVAAGEGELACAGSGGRLHPVFGLWPLELAEELRRAVITEGVRKVRQWTGRYRLAAVEWPDRPHDPFLNINTPEELERLRALLGEGC